MTSTKLSDYQQFILKSRYSKYLDSELRRENQEETIERYLQALDQQLWINHEHKIPNREEIKQALINQDVSPSMRAFMTAGDALFRDNTAGYNCSYIPIQDFICFDEALFILMCGTGVGYSVEDRYVKQLPKIPFIYDHRITEDGQLALLPTNHKTIVVDDSKEGWALSLRSLIECLMQGFIPDIDYSEVRAKGERLKTFGGRASGPEPLQELHEFVIKTFLDTQGNYLTPLQCHDIMCVIANSVVVGGVRRSACISLSDLTSTEMALCKSGDWWNTEKKDSKEFRALANNSAVYESKPSLPDFLREWANLIASYSGERGMFNREACRKIAAKNCRRVDRDDFGTNPCSEIILRPFQFCNLTSVIVRAGDTLENLKRKVRIATQLGTYQATFTYFPYLRDIWTQNTKEEALLGVSMTGVFDHYEFVTSDKLDLYLDKLKRLAVDVNKELSQVLGINQAAAVTCNKPEGNNSQYTNSSSGLHPRFSPYYIRSVRADIKDPLTDFMKDLGVPWEPAIGKEDSTVVFYFPQKSPEGAITQSNITAIEHLEIWLTFQRAWCEHKPSITIYVKDSEWFEVADWVYKHFDELSGVSFLPYDGGVYKQAPYQRCSKEEYEEMLEKMPQGIDWDSLIEYTDNVEGSQTLACTAGQCEI